MDIYAYIKKDHKNVSDLFNQILSNDNPAHRKKVFGQIKRELILHGVSEQATFYKALEENCRSQDQVKHDVDEHKSIKRHLTQLGHLDINSPEWLVEFKTLVDVVTTHAQEEEDFVFKVAQQVLPKRMETDLAQEMDAYKKYLQNKVTKF